MGIRVNGSFLTLTHKMFFFFCILHYLVSQIEKLTNDATFSLSLSHLDWNIICQLLQTVQKSVGRILK